MDVTGDLNTALSVGLEITSAAELTYNSSDVDTVITSYSIHYTKLYDFN